MAAPDGLSSSSASADKVSVNQDSKATESIIALKYWVRATPRALSQLFRLSLFFRVLRVLPVQARATNYQPTQPELETLNRCEEYAKMLWRIGVFTGGGSGMGLAAAVRVPLTQRIAVGAAFASAGGFYSQYKANLPCLQALIELDQLEAAPASPLATQARAILRDGAGTSVRNLQGAEAERRAPEVPRRAAVALAVGGGGARFTDDGAFSHAHGEEAREHETPILAAPTIAAADRATTVPPTGGDSWEAVRQRYQARAAGDDPTVARAAHEAWSRDVPQAGAPANDLGRGRRTVRNAYGDEIVVEK